MLEELDSAVEEKKSKLETRWAAFTAIGSFTLYLFGYLTLRFHLSAMGVATDLAVLDERYLFAGAQFLVYFLCAIPIVLLPLLFLLPFRGRLKRLLLRWVAEPNRVLISGVIVSVLLIQVVIRQCLPFTNLLLSGELPKSALIRFVLLDEGDGIRSLYFSSLVACVLVLAGLLYLANRQTARPSFFWSGLLALLIVIQFLLLPVTFGIVIADKDFPRLATLEGKEALKPNEEAWLVWQGATGTTFFVRTWRGGVATRKLITIENKKIEKTEITGYDRVLRLLF